MSAGDALRRHWPEYAIECIGLAVLLAAAGCYAVLLEYPRSPVHAAIADPVARRAVRALLMGTTAVAIVYSPWGRRSGAHLNPAITLAFWRLGKVRGWDAAFYILSQFAGASLAVMALSIALGMAFTGEPVGAIATRPHVGVAVAFVVEAAVAFALMLVVLVATNTRSLAHSTGLLVGALVAAYTLVAAPLTGASLNPARSIAGAVGAHMFAMVWVYVAAPPLGMLAAAQVFTRLMRRTVICAKLVHDDRQRCIFHCGYRAAGAVEP